MVACAKRFKISRIKNAQYSTTLDPFWRGVLGFSLGIICVAVFDKLLALSSAIEHLSGLLLEGSGGTLIRDTMRCIFRKITCIEFCDLTIPEGGG